MQEPENPYEVLYKTGNSLSFDDLSVTSAPTSMSDGSVSRGAPLSADATTAAAGELEIRPIVAERSHNKQAEERDYDRVLDKLAIAGGLPLDLVSAKTGLVIETEEPSEAEKAEAAANAPTGLAAKAAARAKKREEQRIADTPKDVLHTVQLYSGSVSPYSILLKGAQVFGYLYLTRTGDCKLVPYTWVCPANQSRRKGDNSSAAEPSNYTILRVNGVPVPDEMVPDVHDKAGLPIGAYTDVINSNVI